ncbi:MAG: class II aldolase/adducin family protein [Eubacteriales bacterium]
MNEIQKKYQVQIEQIVEACHRLAELGYVTSSGGNLSIRVEEDLIWITPTKTSKRIMKFDDICAVNLKGDIIFAPNGKFPTSETPFHTRIMKKRPDVTVVIHAHPPVMTGFAIANSDLLAKPVLPEPIMEVGPALIVKYATPGSEELSKEFEAVIDDSNCFLMENHGVVLCGTTDIFEAVEQFQMMECMAVSVITALQLGNYKTIPEHYFKDMDHVIAQRNVAIPGAKGKYNSATELFKIS